MSDIAGELNGPLDNVEAPTGSGSIPHDGRRGSFLVGAGILLSRVAGLVREMTIAGFLGVGGTADVFKAALRIPNLLQNLLGEGVLSASFIPVYSRLLEKDEREANQLAGTILGLLLIVMTAVVSIGVIFAGTLARVITPGFSGQRLELATTLLRIMFPAIAFLVLSAFCTGVLNSHRRFFLSYASPVMWNATQIAFLVTAGIMGTSNVGLAHALAWGVLVGSVLEVAIQVPAVRRLTAGARLSADYRSPNARDVLKRFAPVALGRGVIQILLYVELFLASLLAAGGISALTYGQVLYLLPISLFGMAVAAAELPELARLGQSGHAAIKQRLHLGIERIVFYVAFTAAIYIFAGDIIVAALLQRGRFSASDTMLVWFVVATFALGLLGTTQSRLLQNTLYALNQPTTVARIAVARVALAAGLGALFMFPLDRFVIVNSQIKQIAPIAFRPLPDYLRNLPDGPPHLGIVGLALGAALSSWIEYRLLKAALERHIGPLPTFSRGARWSLVAALVAGVASMGLRIASTGLPPLVTAVLVGVPTVLIYLAITGAAAVPESVALLHRLGRFLPARDSSRR
ncbi:MAG: murein biosynthesis integral membrane protein MurJ [Acidimicrobiia bacterium]|nr:murein biosynthesis integral membrane protein MurJ [Acidimicrobiia bacterium]